MAFGLFERSKMNFLSLNNLLLLGFGIQQILLTAFNNLGSKGRDTFSSATFHVIFQVMFQRYFYENETV